MPSLFDRIKEINRLKEIQEKEDAKIRAIELEQIKNQQLSAEHEGKRRLAQIRHEFSTLLMPIIKDIADAQGINIKTNIRPIKVEGAWNTPYLSPGGNGLYVFEMFPNQYNQYEMSMLSKLVWKYSSSTSGSYRNQYTDESWEEIILGLKVGGFVDFLGKEFTVTDPRQKGRLEDAIVNHVSKGGAKKSTSSSPLDNSI